MTVWVVKVDSGYGDGEYISGVFSTEELANKHASKYHSWVSVIECVVDELA